MSKRFDWSAPTTNDEVQRRAAGRRRYNSIRTLNKQLRRQEILELLRLNGHHWGSQAQMARNFGVSESTISRDIKAIFDRLMQPCPVCRQVSSRSRWHELAQRGSVVMTEDGRVELPCGPAAPRPPRPQPPRSLASLEYLRSVGAVPDEDDGSGELPEAGQAASA